MTSTCLNALLLAGSLLTVVLCSCTQAVRSVARVSAEPLRFSIDQGPSLPQGRGGHAAGIIDDHLVVIGGNQWNEARTEKIWHADSLVLRDGKWIPGPSLPHPVAYPAFAQLDDQLVLAGGFDGKEMRRDCFVLRARGGDIQVDSLPDLPIACDAAGGTVMDGKMYVFGGETSEGMLSQVLRLDLSHPQTGWKTCAPLPAGARSFVAAVAQGSRIYVIGGVSNWKPLTCHHDVCVYDSTRDRWTALSNLELSGYAWSASPVDGSHLLLAGRASGEISDGVWLVNLPEFSMRQVARAIVPTATAPLVRMAPREWWLIGGEPDSNKNRTPVVSQIHLLD